MDQQEQTAKASTYRARLQTESGERKPGSPIVVQLSLASVLVGSTGAFQVFAQTGGGATLVYAPLAVACWLIIIQLLSPVHFPKERWAELLPLLILCLAPTLSVLWSSYQQKTVNDAITLVVFGLLGITISKYLNFETRLRTAALVIGGLLVISVLVVALFPTYGIDNDTRSIAWRGIFLNKNSLGRVAAIELLLAAYLFVKGSGFLRIVWLLSILLSVAVILNSDSQTALVAALAGLAVAFILERRRSRRNLASRFATILVASYLVLSNLIPLAGPIVAGYLSRDTTLTGRTFLWSFANQFADQKPIFGWGFGAVWQTPGGVGDAISQQLTFVPGSAHNGLIDLRLQLGLFGICLFASGLWMLIYRTLKSTNATTQYPWKIGYVVLLLTMDLAESTFFFGLTWFLAWVFLSDYRSKHGEFH
ncbi:O-antigen ligase family protein [Arthrobacter sp. YA7-1]|uniref:O-antigen ligase family protein n=1 Tax=Arthrobacter sp. YA7-1 TaxID=2987701 RepID=UPI002225D438|nr:O-antigen ligase family protein [Arthrobacter sp. YA7-1]UYY80859.1 O-antigen ligase family protein [Arthrobacter sp. YA7-1]